MSGITDWYVHLNAKRLIRGKCETHLRSAMVCVRPIPCLALTTVVFTTYCALGIDCTETFSHSNCHDKVSSTGLYQLSGFFCDWAGDNVLFFIVYYA